METERDYIDLNNAMRVSGFSHSYLRQLARRGQLRTRKIKPYRGGHRYEYHIDDCRVLSWPRTGDIAAAAGIDARQLARQVHKHRIPMAKIFANKMRYPPRTAELLLRWIDRGYPNEFGGIRRR